MEAESQVIEGITFFFHSVHNPNMFSPDRCTTTSGENDASFAESMLQNKRKGYSIKKRTRRINGTFEQEYPSECRGNQQEEACEPIWQQCIPFLEIVTDVSAIETSSINRLPLQAVTRCFPRKPEAPLMRTRVAAGNTGQTLEEGEKI